MNHYSSAFPDMLQAEQPLRELLRHFTYRPGWEFEVHQGRLTITATVIDAYNQDRTMPLTFSQILPFPVPMSFTWERWLFDQIMKVERHEAQEFFQIGGVPVYDPHKEEEFNAG